MNAPPVEESQATASQYMSRYGSLAERIRDRSRPMQLASESWRYKEKRSSSSRNASWIASAVEAPTGRVETTVTTVPIDSKTSLVGASATVVKAYPPALASADCRLVMYAPVV